MPLSVSTISLSQVLSTGSVRLRALASTLSLSQSFHFTGDRNKALGSHLTFVQTATCVVQNRRVLTSHLTVGQSLSQMVSKGLASSLSFSQTICRTGRLSGHVHSTVFWSQYLGATVNDFDSPQNGTPPITPTPTVTFGGPVPVVGITSLQFFQTMVVSGGRIYDYACYPAMLISDEISYTTIEDDGWSALIDSEWLNLTDPGWFDLQEGATGWIPLTDSQWYGLTDFGWYTLGAEIVVYSEVPLNFSGIASPAWRHLYASTPKGVIDGVKFKQSLTYTKIHP